MSKKVLDILIGQQQKGFIQGRNISECTREIYDYIYEYEEKNIPGLILLIDFEKAFDSIAWDFVHLVLDKFGFAENLIKLFQQDTNSRVAHNGWI